MSSYKIGTKFGYLEAVGVDMSGKKNVVLCHRCNTTKEMFLETAARHIKKHPEIAHEIDCGCSKELKIYVGQVIGSLKIIDSIRKDNITRYIIKCNKCDNTITRKHETVSKYLEQFKKNGNVDCGCSKYNDKLNFYTIGNLTPITISDVSIRYKCNICNTEEIISRDSYLRLMKHGKNAACISCINLKKYYEKYIGIIIYNIFEVIDVVAADDTKKINSNNIKLICKCTKCGNITHKLMNTVMSSKHTYSPGNECNMCIYRLLKIDNARFKITAFDDVDNIVTFLCKKCNNVSSMPLNEYKQMAKSNMLCPKCIKQRTGAFEKIVHDDDMRCKLEFYYPLIEKMIIRLNIKDIDSDTVYDNLFTILCNLIYRTHYENLDVDSMFKIYYTWCRKYNFGSVRKQPIESIRTTGLYIELDNDEQVEKRELYKNLDSPLIEESLSELYIKNAIDNCNFNKRQTTILYLLLNEYTIKDIMSILHICELTYIGELNTIRGRLAKQLSIDYSGKVEG